MAVFFSPIVNDAPYTVNGAPASGYKLFTYTAGTTTKQTTYTTSAGNVANSNPIILNSAGYAPNEIWLTSGVTYKFVLAPSNDSDPPVSPVWTRDNISAINDTTITISEWIAGNAPTFISTTSFTLAGDATSIYTKGLRLKFTVTAGTVYGTILTSVFTTLTTVTLEMDTGQVLDSGLSVVAYAILNAVHPSMPPYLETMPIAVDHTDPTKRIKLVATGITTGTARSLTAQDKNYTLAGIDDVALALPLSSCEGRLTLTTLTPVTTADVTAATTLYFTPYRGAHISLYDGSANWNGFLFSELSIAVPATTSQMYDVFAFNNSGTPALELLAWTNDTTRATALVMQNGVLVKSGVTTRRYLGSFRTTTVSGQTEDSFAKRYVWNYSNRLIRPMRVIESTTSWNYTTAVLRQANGAATNQLDFVVGVAENPVTAEVTVTSSNTSANVITTVGIGLDSTTVDSSSIRLNPSFAVAGSTAVPCFSRYKAVVAAGRHFLAWLEASSATGTTTWFGNHAGVNDQSGIQGEMLG